MKRCILYVLAAALFLIPGCMSKRNEAEPPASSEAEAIIGMPPEDSGEMSPSAFPPDYDPADYIGFYDPYFDYASAPKYKVQFMVLAANLLYERYDEAFSHWASKMNLDYGGMQETGGDKDAFFRLITEFVSQGVNGFLIEADGKMYLRVQELLQELGTPWMSCITAPRDTEQETLPILHPYIKIENYEIGVHLAEKLLELKNESWPDVSYEEIGMITADFSLYPGHYDYQLGTYDAWVAKTSLENHFFTANNSILLDGGGIVDVDATPFNMKYIIKENPEIKYWLFAAHYTSFAKFAVEVLYELSLKDYGYVISTNAAFDLFPLQSQWDLGLQNAWTTAEYMPGILYTEPIIGALYAFMSGQATPETIWPRWVDVNDSGGEGGTYASLMVPSFWLEYDNYKDILKWSDVYAGSNFFPDYPADGITPDEYNARAEVPDYYSTKAQD